MRGRLVTAAVASGLLLVGCGSNGEASSGLVAIPSESAVRSLVAENPGAPGPAATITPTPVGSPSQSSSATPTPTPTPTPSPSTTVEAQADSDVDAVIVSPDPSKKKKKNGNSGGNAACDDNYAGACVPIVAWDLDCGNIGQSVTVVGIDIHRFDADGDGFGCESY